MHGIYKGCYHPSRAAFIGIKTLLDLYARVIFHVKVYYKYKTGKQELSLTLGTVTLPY